MSGKSRRWLWVLLAGGTLFQFLGFFTLLPETLARIPFTAFFLPIERLVALFFSWLADPLLLNLLGL